MAALFPPSPSGNELTQSVCTCHEHRPLCDKTDGMGDILTNQRLLPVTTEVYWQMTCHVGPYWVLMCRFDSKGSKGVSLDAGDGRSQQEMERQWLPCRAPGLCEYLMTNKVICNSHVGQEVTGESLHPSRCTRA